MSRQSPADPLVCSLVAELPARKWSSIRTPVLLTLVTLLATSVISSAQALADHRQPPVRFREDRLLIKPRQGANAAAVANFHRGQRSEVLRAFPRIGGLQVVRLPAGASVESAVARYLQSGLVEYAEPDFLVQAAVTEPNDPRYLDGTQWGLNNFGQNGGLVDADIDAPEAWDTFTSASNVIVAIIDSGVRYTHQDLAANMWISPHDGGHGLNAINGSNNPLDDNGHGTLMAGVIGAVGNNGLGMVGVAWQVRIMACKFLDSAGNGFVSDAIACMDYARTNGAKVINASWGGYFASAAMADAIAAARDDGVIIVAAVGNNAADNDARPYYPASYELDNIVAVTATTRFDTLASFSSFGATSVDLAAPGSAIYSTFFLSDNSYLSLNGTSLAAPHVSGALALMCARFPTDTHRQLVARLLAATDPLPALTGRCVTGGRLNLARALGPSVIADFTASRTSGALPLTVGFVDKSFGAITNRIWDFGDGTRLTNVIAPTHVFTDEGAFNVTLTVTGNKGQTSTTNLTVRTVANYRIVPAEFRWLGVGEGQRLFLGDNGVSAPQPLPFDFYFYGQRYNQIYVAANGLIGFINQGLEHPANGDLPDPESPNAILCPFWDDLNPAAGGSVLIGSRGKPSHRQVVVTWMAVPRAGQSPGPNRFSFQAVLFESSQRILFQYLHVNSGKPGSTAGRSATVGVENETGEVAARYSFNGGAGLTNRQAILFVPTSRIGVTNVVAASLTAAAQASAEGFEFRLAGQPDQVYVIMATTNLVDWTPVFTNTASADGTIGFLDPPSTNFDRRFYRAWAAP